MSRYRAGQWMQISLPPNIKPPIGKPEPTPKRKDRATKPKRRKRRNRN